MYLKYTDQQLVKLQAMVHTSDIHLLQFASSLQFNEVVDFHFKVTGQIQVNKQ
jgi:hypothetical protein